MLRVEKIVEQREETVGYLIAGRQLQNHMCTGHIIGTVQVVVMDNIYYIPKYRSIYLYFT